MQQIDALEFPALGLYVLTPESVPERDRLDTIVGGALASGAIAMHYGDKLRDRPGRQVRAAALRGLCRDFAVPFIVNVDAENTDAVRADVVHLRRHDASMAAALYALGPQVLIGVSCYDSCEREIAAIDEGADYSAFGSFFPHRQNREPRARTEVIIEASSKVARPTVASGGITLENAGALLASGANLLAVISSVFFAPALGAPARKFSNLF